MIVNINQRIRAKLTQSGKDVYQAYLDQFPTFRFPGEAAQIPDVLEIPLWEFMQIFGNVLFIGQTAAPFTENNELEILEE